MTNSITASFTEIKQNSIPLFKGKTQKIIFISVSIIAALASTTLIIGAIIFNMPLLCIALILLFCIVLLSFFLLSNFLSNLTRLPEVTPSNITSPFTPKTVFLTNFSTKINKKTTQAQAQALLHQLTKEAHQKIINKSLPQVKLLKGNSIFPPIIPIKNKSTAIVAFSDLNSATITRENVTERSWESAQNSNLPKGAVSSGYVEYKNPEHNSRYPFVRLLIQANGTTICDDYNIHNFIKILKTTYLNIFAACEKEGICVVQIPSSGYCLSSEIMLLDNQNLAAIFNKIAFLEALLYFNFCSIKTIYFVSEKTKSSSSP